jgi:hypothetical protein
MDWQAMVMLGAYHGINPGMGWLFAVALGMQAGSARGVWRAVLPIAVGHAIAIGIVIVIARLVGLVVPMDVLKGVVAATLITLGLYRLCRHRHPRFGGMQVGFLDLMVWSFLMASAHGAGFMVVPFLVPSGTRVSAAEHAHAGHLATGAMSTPGMDAMAGGVHTAAYLTVMTLAAWLVYRKLGLSLLRRTWLNLDWVWAAALVVTGFVVLLK